MAQTTIKDYFPSKKARERRKKRPLQSPPTPERSKKRIKIGEDDTSLSDIRTLLSSEEPTPAIDKSLLNCFETLPLVRVSPLRRGAACVRLTLAPSSDKVEGKEKTPLFSETQSVPAVKTEPADKPGDNISPSSVSALKYHDDSPSKPKNTTPEKSKAHVGKPAITDLPLPKHYELLAEKFHCTDTIVNMFQRRGEICTFTKLKLAVQGMNGRLFSTSDVAKMVTVYPTALLLAQQMHIPGAYGREIFNSYQLTIECNLAELAGGDQPVLPVNSSSRPHLASFILLRRRQKFKTNLVTIVKQHYKEFLANQSLPVSLTDDEIDSWATEFILDTVPEIDEAPLPQPPASQMRCMTAKDVLDKVELSLMPARMVQALEKTASCSGEKPPEVTTPSNPAIDKALKGLSQDFVDKIRMKELCKAKAAMTRNHETVKKFNMLTALPSMCRIIKNLFIADKKATMPVEKVSRKLMDNSGRSLDAVESHLDLMLEVLPQWLKKVSVRKITYLKIDKSISIKTIMEEIEKRKDSLY